MVRRKYCDEYTKIIKRCAACIEMYMLGEEHAMVASPQYKEGNMSFWRLTDFLKRFVAANQSLIKDHQ